MTPSKLLPCLLPSFVLIAVPATVHGQFEQESNALDERLRVMQDEMDQLRRDNRRMQTEIGELRGASDADWMTEEHRAEIESLVQDVLADSDTRSSLLQSGVIAGWSDHFYLASPDDSFHLRIGGQMQVRGIVNYQDDRNRIVYGFENTRTKLGLSGRVFRRDTTFMLRGDYGRAGGAMVLEDAWVQFRLNNDWAIRIGQFKLPMQREELVNSSRQLAVERSLINENMNFGRSQGVMLIHALDASKFMVAFSDGIEDNLGGFGTLQGTAGGNATALTEDSDWALTARHEWLVAGSWGQFEDFTSPVTDTFGMLIGFAAHTQEEEHDITGPTRERRLIAATVDMSIEWGGANFFGAVNYSYTDHPSFGPLTIWGIVMQGGFYVADDVELFVRAEYGWWDDRGFGFTDVAPVTIGANYYLHGHSAKFTVDLGYADQEIDQNWDSDLAGYRRDSDGVTPQVVFRTQFQLLF